MDPLSRFSDEELVEAANREEPGAFAALYERHKAWVKSLALRFVLDDQAANDVLQEAFLHLWSRFPGFELTAKLRTYLYPVVKHTAMQRRWSAQSSGELPEGAFLDPPGDAKSDLLSALAVLTPVQREAILLRYVDDLELAEIAQAVDVPLGTVKSRLHHALATLRDDPRAQEYFTP